MRHSFEAHSSSPNFSFACGVHGYPQTFTALSGMASHLRRKHRGVDLDDAHSTPMMSSEEEQSCDVVPTTVDLPELQHEEDSPELAPVPAKVNRLERSAALFLITLKERYEITQSALNFAVSQVQQMVSYAVEDIKESVEECLLPHLQDPSFEVHMSELFGAPDPFSSLQNEYMQTKYYREKFDLIVSFDKITYTSLVACSIYAV